MVVLRKHSGVNKITLTGKATYIYFEKLLKRKDGVGGLDGGGDVIELANSLGRHDATAIGTLLDDLHRLQLLQHLAGDAGGSAGPMAGAAAVVPAD